MAACSVARSTQPENAIVTRNEENGLKKWMVGVGSGVAVALIMQTGALLYWIGKIDGRIQAIEQSEARTDARITYLERLEHSYGQR